MDLNLLLAKLPGIGPYFAKKLERLELYSVEDLIYHFPSKYEDFSKIKKIKDTALNESVTIIGEVWSTKTSYTKFGKRLTQIILNDGTSPIELIFFHSPWVEKQIQTGEKLQVSGKITKYKGRLSIIMPKWEKVGKTIHTGRLVPVYPETYGVSSKWLRTKINNLLPLILPSVQDFLPNKIKKGMLSLNEALEKIHFPGTWEDVHKAKQRLSFDELFLIQLATLKARGVWQKKQIIHSWVVDEKLINKFIESLPFSLTSSQKKVLNEIISDLKKQVPMNRLLQGEVGSGKTVVATAVAYIAHLNDFQTLFMAPTEILAWQHSDTISKLLKPYGISVGIYTGSRKKITRSAGDSEEGSRREAAANEVSEDARRDTELAGPAEVIIGTHALLSEKLLTNNVGLIIIDEQQRFGVKQRTFLRNRAKAPHFLTLSATPIPRTVALTLYGDLDLSVISELPKGRPKISTHLVPGIKRSDSYKWIEKKIKMGDQAFIITPLIEESETLVSVKAAKKEFKILQEKIFPNLTLGLLHGRMKAKEKISVISEFRSGKIQILVSTSVVEVGMDIPTATIIVIEGAERFGLAQLHQLRGRVGRGIKESYCLLYTSDSTNEENIRLKHLEKTFDGLKLAEADLKIRGAGEIFGTAQHGRWNLKVANLSDLSFIEKTRVAAQKILDEDPTLDKYPQLQARLSSLASNVMPD